MSIQAIQRKQETKMMEEHPHCGQHIIQGAKEPTPGKPPYPTDDAPCYWLGLDQGLRDL